MGAFTDVALLTFGQNPVLGAGLSNASGGQSIAASTYTVITWPTVDFDTSGTQIASTSNGTLTANRTGLWFIGGSLGFGSVATGTYQSILITVNATTATNIVANASGSAVLSFGTYIPVSKPVRLAAGDVVRMLALTSAANSVGSPSFFGMVFVGPA